MEETKVIYHIDDQETPYLIKIPKLSDTITLLDLKNALNKFNYKYFFKSMDDDFGIVKEEIIDDKSKLPSFNGRIITWLVTSECSTSDTQSQCAEGTVCSTGHNNTKKNSQDSLNKLKQESKQSSSTKNSSPSSSNAAISRNSPNLTNANINKLQSLLINNANSNNNNNINIRPLAQQQHQPTAGTCSIFSSDLDATSFVDSDDDTNTRYSTSTHTTNHSSRLHGQKKKKRKHKLPVLSQASSFSSITDSTMSLNIVTITLNMETASFLGISIVGQSTRGGDGGIYVGSIMKGGAVAQDGRIEPGDMILEVNGISFENMSNDDAVRTLREAVQRPGPITLVVAKCWDPSPRGYFTIPRQEPIRPIDPSAWIMHSEACMGSMWDPRPAVGEPSPGPSGAAMGPVMLGRDNMTSATSSVVSSVPPNDFVIRAAHSSATSSSSHSSKSYADLNLTKNADMSLVVRAMAQPDSGLDVRDRMWLKIPIPHSFIGSELVDWLYSHVEGFVDRRDARRYACNLLKYGFIQHTVNKISFSEQCYYVFGSNVIQDLASMSLADDIDSVSSVGIQQQQHQQHRDTIGPLPPPPSWSIPPSFPPRPTYPITPNIYSAPLNSIVNSNSNNNNSSNIIASGGAAGNNSAMMMNMMMAGGGGAMPTPYNYINDGASYISMPGYNGAESVISSVKRDRTCACIVTHTYKQIRKLWDNPDKPHHHHHHPGGAKVTPSHMTSPMVARQQAGAVVNSGSKFNADIEQSTSSETESEGSVSSQSKNSKDRSKQTTSSSTKTAGCDSGLGSVGVGGAFGERSLPPLPTCVADDCDTTDGGMAKPYIRINAETGVFADDALQIMGDL